MNHGPYHRTSVSAATIAVGLVVHLVPAAHAQGPDVLEYTFNGGDLTNSAVPGSGAAVAANGGAVLFRPGGITFGTNDPAATSGGGGTVLIDSGWDTDLGGGDWSIGCFLDLTQGAGDPNYFQYLFGDASAGGFRAFVDGAAGDGNVSLNGPFDDVVITGGGSEIAPVHVCWVHDSSAGEIRGYLDGVLNNTRPQLPFSLQGSGVTGFYAMAYNGSSSSMRAGTIMDEFRVYRRAIDAAELASWVALRAESPVGTHFCSPAIPNSTGQPGRILGTGTDIVAQNDLTLHALLLPTRSYGYFLNSRVQGFIVNPGGSLGALCLAGPLGQFRGPGQVGHTGSTGSIELLVDLTAVPTASGPIAVLPGETWFFQAWYRDAVGGQPASNFTDGLTVLFR